MQKKIEKEFKDGKKAWDAHVAYTLQRVGSAIDDSKQSSLKIASFLLSGVTDLSYDTAIRSGVLHRLEQNFRHIFGVCALRVNDLADELQQDSNLYGLVFTSYLSRKSTPPWVTVHLNLNEKYDASFDRKALVDFYFSKMADDMINRLKQGLVQKETLNQLMTRLRQFFPTKPTAYLKESSDQGMIDYLNETGPVEENKRIFNKPPVEVTEGVYTWEMIDEMRAKFDESGRFSSRQYRDYFSDDLKRVNRYLRDLEQMLYSNALEALHSGMLEIGSKNMGITDMQWKVDRPQKKCDECTVRDGLSMKEIKAKIKDKYKDAPPPIHPNCRCELIPMIKDDWFDEQKKKLGYDFEPETGTIYKADAQEKSLGYKDMTMNEWISAVRG